MMQKLKNSRYAFIIGICFLIGILVGKSMYFDFPFFQMENKVSLVDLISFFVTVVLAIYIASIIDREKDVQRGEKELINRRLEEILRGLNELELYFEDGKIEYVNATSHLKRLGRSLNHVFTAIEKSKLKIASSKKEDFINQVKQLRESITQTPTVSQKKILSANLDIDVKEGVILYQKSRLNQIENEFSSLKDKVLTLQIEIINS